MLHKRKLGQGGLDITTVGFGSWAVGEAVGPSAGDLRTMPTRFERSFTPSRAA